MSEVQVTLGGSPVPLANPEVAMIGVYTAKAVLERALPHYRVQGMLQFRMGVDKAHEKLSETEFLVKLAVAVELVQPDQVIAVRAEVQLESIVVCVGLDAAALDYQLNRALPARLYAHARVAIEGLTRDTGYRAVTLPPAPLEPASHAVAIAPQEALAP